MRHENIEIITPQIFAGYDKNRIESYQPITTAIINAGQISFHMGWRVVTTQMRSLGLRRNPHILTYPFREWVDLPADQLESSDGDWGGIWTARTPSGARTVQKYMRQEYGVDTRVFRSFISNIMHANSYRVKSQGIFLFDEVNDFNTYFHGKVSSKRQDLESLAALFDNTPMYNLLINDHVHESSFR